MARPSVVLPEPDSPTTPTVWPSRTSSEIPSTAFDVADRAAQEAFLDRKPDLQVLGLQDRLRRGIGGGGCPFGLGREQHLRVRMLRVAEDVFDGSGLDDTTLLHHSDIVGDTAHDAEIVRDEQHRHPELRLQVLEQAEDLRLDRDVERGRGLVGDEKVRPVGERHGDHDALPLAARQLMREGTEARRGIGDADVGEQRDDAIPQLVAADPAVQRQDLPDLSLDRVERVQRRHGFLEHHGDGAAADIPHVGFGRPQEVAARRTGCGRPAPRRPRPRAGGRSTWR